LNGSRHLSGTELARQCSAISKKELRLRLGRRDSSGGAHSAMKPSTRRVLFALTVFAGAAALCVSAAARQPRGGPDAPDSARAGDSGPRELFAVVDAGGVLRRGLHVAKVIHREAGLYEVTFDRDVRGGVHVAGVGSHGQGGVPPVGYAGVESLST